MQVKRLLVIAIFSLTLVSFILFAEPAKTKVIADVNLWETSPKSTQNPISIIAQKVSSSLEINQFAPVKGCSIQPPANPLESLSVALTTTPITLERFRKPSSISTSISNPSHKEISYNPREEIDLAAVSNYGERYLKDLSGMSLNNAPIIVLHETVGSTNSVINFFQEFHDEEDSQASYHTLISLDGTIVYFVPPDKRAFGAGNSVFVSSLGQETVQTNPLYPSSVNNFAYHISLETPEDGMHNGDSHSGYTEAQYQSLGWLVAKTDVPLERITTQKNVDRSGSRIDPRSFDADQFKKVLSEYPRTNEIAIGCP